MTKRDNYKYLSDNGLGFIANVFFTRSMGGKSAAILKALVKLHKAGCDIGCASFMMPDEELIIDGERFTPQQIIDASKFESFTPKNGK